MSGGWVWGAVAATVAKEHGVRLICWGGRLVCLGVLPPFLHHWWGGTVWHSSPWPVCLLVGCGAMGLTLGALAGPDSDSVGLCCGHDWGLCSLLTSWVQGSWVWVKCLVAGGVSPWGGADADAFSIDSSLLMRGAITI